METHRRGSDGRRRFSLEFKRERIGRVVRGEVTVAELSRELGIEQSVLRRWKHLTESGAQAAVAANEDVVPASELRTALQRIKEPERALGRKTTEVEILQAARDEGKERAELLRPVQAMTGRKLAPICSSCSVPSLRASARARGPSARSSGSVMRGASTRR